jgi:tetratricopeptide (TPR) repeat protein
MKLVDKYRWGANSNVPISNIEIDSLSTLESIKNRQGWMIAAQVATVAAIANQTQKTEHALKLVNDTLTNIDETIQNGFDSLEMSIERLECNLIENLNEIKWYLFNVDKKLNQLINLVKFSSATKSAELNTQGFILYKIGSFSEAILQFNKSLEENPINIEAYVNLAFVQLRQDKLQESIENFEKAAKLVDEDYSYFEEINAENLKATKIFILENLASLYAIEEKYNLSILTLEQILELELDKNTEILTKFKLAKYHCNIGETATALEIINEFIDKQYFEPIAFAVSNNEFNSIQKEILENLQDKLVFVKGQLIESLKNHTEKINSMDLESTEKESITIPIEALHSGLLESANYSVLLTNNFRQRFLDYLSVIEFCAEINNTALSDLLSKKLDIQKLMEIEQLNNNIDDNSSNESDIQILSHRILLSKIKQNVNSCLSEKILYFQLCIDSHEQILNEIRTFLYSVQHFSKANIIDHIDKKFRSYYLHEKIKSLLTNTSSKYKGEFNLAEEYFEILNKYSSRGNLGASLK